MMRIKIVGLVAILTCCFNFCAFAGEETDKVYDVYHRDITSKQLTDEPAGTERIPQAASGEAVGSNMSFSPYQTFKTGSWPEVVAIADINGDGLNDVGVATSYYFDAQNDNRLHIFVQDSSNQLVFQNKYPTAVRPQSIDAGDLNGDGKTDIVVGNFQSNTLGVFTQNNSGLLDPMVSYGTSTGPDSISIADLNNDGLSDIAVSHWNADGIGIFKQNAAGALDAMHAYSVMHAGYDQITTGDVNNDGLQDVVFMRGQGANPPIVIFHQNIAGGLDGPVYLDYRQDGFPWTYLPGGVSIGDINGDKRNDIVMVAGGNKPSSKVVVWLQDENGSFGLPVAYDAYDCPEAVKLADINGDGLNEVIVAHGGWTNISVYKQNHGVLDPYILFPVPYASHYQPQGLAIGDVNGDEKPDIAVADYNHGLVVLYNTTNFPPILNPIGGKSVNEGQLLDFNISAKDLEEDVLDYSVSNLPQGAKFDPITGVFSWRPTYQQAGEYKVRFNVTDGYSVASETVNITVNNVNLIPVAYIDSISPSPAIEGEAVTLTGHGADSDGEITDHKWSSSVNGDLGNGSVLTVSTLSVGKHMISFKVKDNDGGWSDSVSRRLIVKKAENGVIYGSVFGRARRFLRGFVFVPLQDATVRVINITRGTVVTVKTDVDGRYVVPRLSKGIYKVIASKVGYRSETRLEHLKKNAQKKVDFRLL